MAQPAARPSAPGSHLVFLTRDPVVHQRVGSTTYILGLLTLLQAQGAAVTLVSTSAYSRSPRLFFRQHVALPAGVVLRAPGYLRLGRLYLRPWSLKAWARLLTRAALRLPLLRRFAARVQAFYGDALFGGAWDLTLPTAAEAHCAEQAVPVVTTAVVANYCLWGDLLHSGRLGPRRTAILMHDLLSQRQQRFEQSGTALDMPPITAEEEIRRLGGADLVLAAQAREAELIAPLVRSRVVVTPVVLTPRALPEDAILPQRCLLVGSNIPPNQAALQFLLQAVWPHVRAAAPTATLAIAGSLGQAPVLRDSGTMQDGVVCLGIVDDLQQEYARAAVCLVPLQFGTGIKIKLLEALSFGKAVVSTSTGVEGLPQGVQDAVCLADEPEDFAQAILALLGNTAHRQARQQAALLIAGHHFGPLQSLDPALRELLLRAPTTMPSDSVHLPALS